MAGAIKCIKDGKMGVNRAADQYGVPRTTLKDRLLRRVIPGANPGPVPYLILEEEDELVKYLLTSADIGYPKTKQEVLAIVRQAVHKKLEEEKMQQKNFKGRGGGIDLLKDGQQSGYKKVMLWQCFETMLSRRQILHSITVYSRRHWRRTNSWDAPAEYTIWMNLECL